MFPSFELLSLNSLTIDGQKRKIVVSDSEEEEPTSPPRTFVPFLLTDGDEGSTSTARTVQWPRNTLPASDEEDENEDESEDDEEYEEDEEDENGNLAGFVVPDEDEDEEDENEDESEDDEEYEEDEEDENGDLAGFVVPDEDEDEEDEEEEEEEEEEEVEVQLLGEDEDEEEEVEVQLIGEDEDEEGEDEDEEGEDEEVVGPGNRETRTIFCICCGYRRRKDDCSVAVQKGKFGRGWTGAHCLHHTLSDQCVRTALAAEQASREKELDPAYSPTDEYTGPLGVWNTKPAPRRR